MLTDEELTDVQKLARNLCSKLNKKIWQYGTLVKDLKDYDECWAFYNNMVELLHTLKNARSMIQTHVEQLRSKVNDDE